MLEEKININYYNADVLEVWIKEIQDHKWIHDLLQNSVTQKRSYRVVAIVDTRDCISIITSPTQ